MVVERDPKILFGRLVSKARSKAGLSHEALALAMQGVGLPISASRLAAIEKGERFPDTEVAAALEGVLGLDLRGFELPHPRTRVLTRESGTEQPAPVQVRASEVSSPKAPPSEPVSRPIPTRPAPPSHPPPPRIDPAAQRTRPGVGGTKVAEYPRLTVYLDPGTKALVEGTSSVLGVPVYQLLTTAFLRFYEGLGRADRDLIERVAAKRKER
jgi:transcriptional regulator with XRE-family HTH domain